MFLSLELAEAFTDSLIGHGADPKALHRAFHTGFLHHPTLDELSLLSGITAVDDFVGMAVELFYDGKLLFNTGILNELYAESLRYHRQRGEAPVLPVLAIVVGLLQLAEVSESPGHLVAITLHIALCALVRSEYAGDVLSYAGLLCNTNNQSS